MYSDDSVNNVREYIKMGVNAYLVNSRGEHVTVNKLNVTTITKHSNGLVTTWFNDGSFCEFKGDYNTIVKSLETSEDERNKEAKKQYKRDMMLQLVRNETLTEIVKQLPEGNEFHKVIVTMADNLTEEAFK